jgi:hypothetical protein
MSSASTRLRTGIRVGALASIIGLSVYAFAGGILDRSQRSGMPPAYPSSWREMAVDASTRATTDFGRAALRDGTVTRNEYEESIARVIECGRAKGRAITATPRYGLYVFSIVGADGDAVFQECSKGDVAIVQAIYYGEYTDPDNRGDVVTFECLVGKGVLPAANRFDSATFVEDINRLLQSSPPTARVHQIYELCMYNPLGHPYSDEPIGGTSPSP